MIARCIHARDKACRDEREDNMGILVMLGLWIELGLFKEQYQKRNEDLEYTVNCGRYRKRGCTIDGQRVDWTDETVFFL